jgi:pyruvate dehydrogenase E1 component alpha subunit
MHITDLSRGILGVNPIVGAGVAHAVGAAMSAKVRGTTEVVAAFFGEGAAGIGTVHECMNMASIWKLPLIFVCENNGYAQATPFEYASSVANVADRAVAYGMPGAVVDGQDVVAVWQATTPAVARARVGDGPSLIEAKTYRYHGHHQSDDTLRYRLAEEEKLARERDCLRRFRERIEREGDLTVAELDEVDASHRATLDEAVEFAKTSPLPGPEELLTDVYVPAAS